MKGIFGNNLSDGKKYSIQFNRVWQQKQFFCFICLLLKKKRIMAVHGFISFAGVFMRLSYFWILNSDRFALKILLKFYFLSTYSYHPFNHAYLISF